VEPLTLRALWRQFLPLSVSDVTMVAGEPLVTTTLAHLPDGTDNLAATGVAKTLAILIESPIIMLLHASNALGGAAASRAALERFTILACVALTAVMGLLALPPVFALVAGNAMGLSPDLLARGQGVLLLMAPWPAAIAWRRFVQGQLIRHGLGGAVARGGLGRLAIVAGLLGAGWLAGLPGWAVAGFALALGVVGEAVFVTVAARAAGVLTAPAPETQPGMPADLPGVWRFYWPLASSSVVVWGGRSLLIAIVARAADGPLALAAWPTAWALVAVASNATRMVQQIVIKHHADVPGRLLWAFAAQVGGLTSAGLLLLAATPPGQALLVAFVGPDPDLLAAVTPVVALSAGLPALVALMNAAQGFLVAAGRTQVVTAAATAGTAALLAAAAAGVVVGLPGASAAAAAMLVALGVELGVLVAARRPGASTPA